MSQITLHDMRAYEEALATHRRILLFKHSPICPVSTAAHEQWKRFLDARSDAVTLFVDVIADRAVARGLAEACGVQHQSPQAILFEGGRAVWDASHDAITADSLVDAWATDERTDDDHDAR